LLIVVLGLFLQSIDSLCEGLGWYLQSGYTNGLTEFFGRTPRHSYDPRSENAMWDRLAKDITEAEKNPAPAGPTLTLNISVIRNKLRCEYVLTGPSTLIDELTREGMYQTEALMQEMLGGIIVNGDAVRFQQPSAEIPGQDKPATLRLQSEGITGDYFAIDLASPPKTRHLQFANKQINVKAEEAEVTNSGLDTESRSGGTSSYRFSRFILEGYGGARLNIVASGGGAEDEPLARLMERSGLLNLPVLGDLVETLLATVPYLLLLIMICPLLPAEEVKLYRTAVGLVLALRFGVSFLSSITTGPWEAAQAAPWMDNFIRRTTGIAGYFHPAYSLSTLLVTLFAGWLWPILVVRSGKTGMEESQLPVSRSRTAEILAVLMTVSAVAGWIFWLAAAPVVPPLVNALWLLAISAILFFWLGWELFPGSQAIVTSIAGAFVTFVLAIGLGLPHYTDSTPKYRFLLRGVAVAIVVTFGMPLIIAFFRLAAALIRSNKVDRLFRHRWVLWAVALAVSLPTTWMVDASKIWPGAVWALAYQLGDLFLFVLVVVLLRILRDPRPHSSWPHLPAVAISTGIVLALTAFYSSTSIWFYFPIPLILGYVLIKWFLLVPPIDPPPPAEARARWNSIAEGALNVHRLERTAAIVRKGLEKQLDKGEITWSAYEKRMEPLTRKLDSERRDSLIDGRPPDPLLFSYGATTSAWENGRTGAIYGLCFALPWILLSLRDILNSHAGESYILLSFLSSALMIVVRWTLYGFFFGYFYAYLRGKNGFQKAVSFWFALVLPSVLASLLSSPLNRASVGALLFWTAQVFVQCLMLGLFAGELQSLHKAGLTWRQLLEFHDLTSLSAWGSTVLLALGTALTAALSTGLQSLISLGLRYVGVLPPGTVPGK
jgi:hypothetical protein